jgi:NADH dehydrogenase FAD-containing subunit
VGKAIGFVVGDVVDGPAIPGGGVAGVELVAELEGGFDRFIG